MYAIIELSGRQWKVMPGSRLDVNRLSTDVGAEHLVERVLLAHDGQQPQVGRPYVTGAQVVCQVVEHRLGPKVITYKYRRRENWRKTVGHRQRLTRLIVKDILLSGAAAPQAAEHISVTAPAKKAKPSPIASRATAQVPTKAKTARPAPKTKSARS